MTAKTKLLKGFIHQPLHIGRVKLPNRLILAPMAGITDAPFRFLAKRFGAGLVVSEMISAQAVVFRNTKTLKMARPWRSEHPVAIQLFGHDPDVMAKAAGEMEAMGADLIDINMGCPQRKIVRAGSGSALMNQPELAAKIVEYMQREVTVPVTVKIRLGWDESSINAVEFACLMARAGASMITVHGRTRSQMFAGRADWKAISLVKEAVDIPVVANGDVTDISSAAECIKISGADAVMIGRAALGRPWIFHEIIKGSTVGPEQKFNAILDHLTMLKEYYGPRTGTVLAKKHVCWYSHGLSNGAKFRQQVHQIEDFERLKDFVEDFFTRAFAQSTLHNLSTSMLDNSTSMPSTSSLVS